MPKQRVFEVYVKRVFSNFEVLKEYIVVSETRPMDDDFKLKQGEKIMKIRELDAEVIVK
jgi:hypothetical protein